MRTQKVWEPYVEGAVFSCPTSSSAFCPYLAGICIHREVWIARTGDARSWLLGVPLPVRLRIPGGWGGRVAGRSRLLLSAAARPKVTREIDKG